MNTNSYHKHGVSNDLKAFEAVVWKLLKRGANNETIIQTLVEKGFDEPFLRKEIPEIKAEILAIKKKRAIFDLLVGIALILFFSSLFYFSVQGYMDVIILIDDVINGSLKAIAKLSIVIIGISVILGFVSYLFYRVIRGVIILRYFLKDKTALKEIN